MKTETISFDLSMDLLASLKLGINDLSRDIRLQAAINYFKEKRLSLGKAAQLAGLNRLVFMDFLSEKGICIFDYDESALKAELDGIEELNQIKNDH